MLNARHFFLALAAAALIAGCGGGEQSASVTPQSAVAALHAAKGAQGARMSQAVSPEAAADQLLDFAESHLPNFFPSHQATMSFPPFRFRYYPETNIYLGVVVTAGMGYTLNGVYVAGGGLGTLANPYFAGLLTDFITPTGGGTGGGTASACYDLSLNDTQGTTIAIDYNYSGAMTGAEHITSTVGAMTTFEGHTARETTVTTSGTHTVTGQGTATVTSNGKNYGLRTGDAETTDYGSVFSFSTTSSGFTFNTDVRTVMSPPAVTHVYSLAAGASITETQSGIATSTSNFGSSTGPFTSTTTTKFVGTESVTVPAGTYNACKFEVSVTVEGSTSLSTNWLMVGKGIHIKSVATDMTIEATSVKLNGASL
jgi:hypothetical protein